MRREHNNSHPAIKGYLVLYNFVQAIGWSLCLGAIVAASIAGKDTQGVFLAGSVYASECSCSIEIAEAIQAGPGEGSGAG